MAVTHSAATRIILADAIGDQLDSGFLEFRATATEVAKLGLAAAAFDAAASQTITANTITSDTDAAGGTIDNAVLKTSGDAIVVNMTNIGTSGGEDITISSLTIGAGDTVSCSALTYTAAP